MQPTEQKIQTSAGMETATETVNRIKGQLGQASTTAIPVSAIETTAPAPLQMPTPQPSTVNPQAAIAGAEQVAATAQERFRIEAEADVAKAQAKESETEAAIRKSVGIIGTESAKRAELEEQKGIPQANKQLRDLTNQLSSATASLREFDRFNVNNLNAMEVEASKRDITKRTFASMSREEQVKANVERANKVADIYAIQASVQLLQGNIEQAGKDIDKALNAIYEPERQNLQMEMMFLQRNASRFDAAQGRLANAKQVELQREFAQIDRAISLVDSAVANGFVPADQISGLMAIKDPELQAEKAQMLIASGIQRQRNEAIAAARAAASGKPPETKNFGTNDAPDWRQWNANSGQWESVEGVGAATVDDTQKSLDQIQFLRDNAKRILGGTNAEGEKYDALYKASGPSSIKRVLGDTFVGDTKYRRLETYADTLKTNVLALMTDPTIRKFFGPQMSNADVRLMSSAGTSLRADSMSPSDLKAEVTRLDDLFNRMQTAVKNGGQTAQPTWGVNVITAPDGTLIEFID